LELLLLVVICFRIRNVKDELSIHSELFFIAAFWILSSFLYYMIFNIFYCSEDPHDDAWQSKLNAYIFLLIQSRNFFTLLISTAFCLKVVRSPNLLYAPGKDDLTSLATLLDFEVRDELF
jgi:hypothetical protein